MRSSLILGMTLALVAPATAHFVMLYPESIGFTDDEQGTGPCGGYTPDLDSKDIVDFHVGGDALSMRSTHQRANWLFRVTTDGDGEDDWEQVWPIVTQSGLGEYCEPHVTVPDKYVGKKGVVGVVSSAMDGLLYQCIVVNFVEGTGEMPEKCSNGSARIFFSEDDDLSALVDNGNDTSQDSDSDSPDPTPTGSASEPSETDDAGASLRPWSIGFGLVNVAVVIPMALVGGLLMA